MESPLVEDAPLDSAHVNDAGDSPKDGSSPSASQASDEDASVAASHADSKSLSAGESLRRSGVGSGVVASLMGIDVAERTNPLSPEEAAALGERTPEGPFTSYIVIGECAALARSCWMCGSRPAHFTFGAVPSSQRGRRFDEHQKTSPKSLANSMLDK